MNPSQLFKHTLVVAALLAVPLAQAATMAKADYQASKTRIDAMLASDKAACRSCTANAKDVCIEQARAKEKVVARAGLEHANSGSTEDENKMQVAKADSGKL